MGEGPMRLLELIYEHGSIRRAAQIMRLSYVKALGLLDRLESKLGRQVLERKTGGNRGGGARLTPFGRSFLRAYDRFRRRVRAFADRELADLLKTAQALPPARRGDTGR